MKIRIEDIPEEGLELHFSGQENTLSSAIQTVALPEGTRISPKVKGDLRLSPGKKKDLFLAGNLQVAAIMQCSRCLSEFGTEQTLDLDLVIRRRGPEGGIPDEVALADAETILVDGPDIDIGEIIVQEVLLELPMKPLCSEECAGLCPTCGAVAGSKECTCREQEHGDPRWAALAQLKAKMKE